MLLVSPSNKYLFYILDFFLQYISYDNFMCKDASAGLNIDQWHMRRLSEIEIEICSRSRTPE